MRGQPLQGGRWPYRREREISGNKTNKRSKPMSEKQWNRKVLLVCSAYAGVDEGSLPNECQCQQYNRKLEKTPYFPRVKVPPCRVSPFPSCRAYKGVIPSAQHRAIPKLARKTNHGERFTCTLRQRVSRVVRATLSFSKTLTKHIGAIKYFLCNYTLTRCEALPG
jgi:hypothetical protein